MKILWIGKYASEELLIDMASKGYKDPAAQQSQSNLIKSFDELGIALDTISVFNVPDDYKNKYVESQNWSRTGDSKDISISFRNIKYVKHLFISHNIKQAARRWSKNNKSKNEIIIIVYGMQSTLLDGAIEAKRSAKGSKIYLVVPDLPLYMDMNMSKIKKVLKKLDFLKIKFQMKYVDGFVLYTKHMAKFLKLEDEKWIVMEGSVNLKDYVREYKNSNYNNDKISIMYSGQLDMRYGIVELLQSIEIIEKENYEFWFTGFGNAVSLIEERAKVDNRIKYFGFLSSREDLLELQASSTMLINLRLPTEKGSSYCFPSKIFEYMTSGRPVLSFKVGGIPNEYYNYLVEIKSPSKEDISSTIMYIGELSEKERQEIGNKAKQFIKSKKNSLHQTEKIINFIS